MKEGTRELGGEERVRVVVDERLEWSRSLEIGGVPDSGAFIAFEMFAVVKRMLHARTYEQKTR